MVVGLPLCLPRHAKASKEAIKKKHERKDLSFTGAYCNVTSRKEFSHTNLSRGSKVTVALEVAQCGPGYRLEVEVTSTGLEVHPRLAEEALRV